MPDSLINQQQMTLDLPVRVAQNREDFFVSTCNAEAVRLVDSWPGWSNALAVLYGEACSGKTHLLHVWQTKSQAEFISLDKMTADVFERIQSDAIQKYFVIDDVDCIFQNDEYEEERRFLFHLINYVRAEQGSLLMVCMTEPSLWSITLKDLQSRMMSAHIVSITPPDDQLLYAVCVKLFYDRQLKVEPQVLDYMMPRLERSFVAVQKAVEKIDAASLTEKRRITLPFIKKVLF